MRHLALIRAFGMCGTLFAVSGCATGALLEQELTKTNTQTVLAFEETVFNKHEVQEAFEHYVGEGFIEHDAVLAGTGPQAEHAYRALISRGSVDAHRTVERSIAQGDLVVTQSSWNPGTRDGTATTLSAIDIYRLREGRIAEHWDVMAPQQAVASTTR